MRCDGGGNQYLGASRIGVNPTGRKITSFAQSVLALHKLQVSSPNSPETKRRKSYLGSGSVLGLSAYTVGDLGICYIFISIILM